MTNNPSQTLRQAEIRDLPKILEIYNHVIATSTAIYEEQPRSLSEHEEWFRAKFNSGWPVLVAESEGKVVGYGSYGNFRAWHCYLNTVEHSLHIDEAYRGRGFGKLLLNGLIDAARAHGFHTMIGGIDSENSASLKLHKKLGFVKAGELVQVGHKFNRWLNLTFMQRMLESN